jgi:hypothetical protein
VQLRQELIKMKESLVFDNKIDKIILRKSKLKYFLISTIIFFGLILISSDLIYNYIIINNNKLSNQDINKSIVFLIICFISVIFLIKYIKISIYGDYFIFDYHKNLIYHNNKMITNFDSVYCLKLDYYYTSDNFEYKLYLILMNNKIIKLDNSLNKDEILSITKIISKKIGIKIIYSDNWRKST